MSNATEFEWNCPLINPANPGSGDAAAQLFEGRRQMRPEIFVREDLQNRVDARKEGTDDPVVVKISFKTLPAKLISKYFPTSFQDWYRRTETQPLKPDERGRRLKQIKALFSSTDFPVLVIEDFNSTGLNGPINSSIPEDDSNSPLYHATNALTCFFRRNGISGKTNKKLGSAGLGRHVYYKASQISSKLIYSVPADLSREEGELLSPLDTRPIFFGQSFQRELAVREQEGQRRYCSYHHLSRGLEEDLPMPFGVEAGDADLVEQVRRDFRLSRNPGEFGCSTIIPFPTKKFTPETLTNSIVREFPIPILQNALKVEIDGLTITGDNIAGLSDAPEVNQHNAFLRDALLNSPDAIVQVERKRLGRPFAEDLFDKTELVELANCFNDSGLVCVEAQIAYGEREEQRGSIRITVRKTDEGQKGRHLVARSGLVLSGHSDRTFRKRSNGMVFVRSDELGSMLRTVENPAHTEWLPGDVDVHKCECADELIRFITNSHDMLARVLTNLDTQDDVSIFSDLVPRGKRPSPGSLAAPFDVTLGSNGQMISLKPSALYDAGTDVKWRLSLVYDSVQGTGRARKGYRPGTFDLREVEVDTKGGSVLDRGACHLDVVLTDPGEFALSLGPCGFAAWADVRFLAEKFQEPAGESA